MPKGTKVHRCFDKLKGEKGEGSAAAICQASTKQSLATGKKTRKSDGKKIDSPKESLEARLHRILLGEPQGPPTARLVQRYDRELRRCYSESGGKHSPLLVRLRHELQRRADGGDVEARGRLARHG